MLILQEILPFYPALGYGIMVFRMMTFSGFFLLNKTLRVGGRREERIILRGCNENINCILDPPKFLFHLRNCPPPLHIGPPLLSILNLFCLKIINQKLN